MERGPSYGAQVGHYDRIAGEERGKVTSLDQGDRRPPMGGRVAGRGPDQRGRRAFA